MAAWHDGWRNWRPLRRTGFARHQGGAVAVEFGLLAIPFFMIVGAILETSLMFLSSQVLETAVQDSSRLIRTGQVQTEGLDAAAFRTRLCDRTFGLFGDCSGVFIDVAPLDDFNAATISPPVNQTCVSDCPWVGTQRYQTGSRNSYVLVQAYYRWPVLLNFAAFGMSSLPDGTRLLGSASTFRNEPF